jgi:monothiol glutaredoxin
MTTTHDQIDTTVKSNDVVLFMKGTADMPQCGFSGRSVQILQHLGVNFKDVNVQLYVKGEFVGGADILMEMFQSGELKQMMADKGIA